MPLGFAQKEHLEYASRKQHQWRGALEETMIALNRGDCRAALFALEQAANAQGQLAAHTHASGVHSPASAAVSATLDGVRRGFIARFHNECVCAGAAPQKALPERGGQRPFALLEVDGAKRRRRRHR